MSDSILSQREPDVSLALYGQYTRSEQLADDVHEVLFRVENAYHAQVDKVWEIARKRRPHVMLTQVSDAIVEIHNALYIAELWHTDPNRAADEDSSGYELCLECGDLTIGELAAARRQEEIATTAASRLIAGKDIAA